MAKFILLLHEEPSEIAELAPEEMQGVIEKYKAWRERVASEGKLLGGPPSETTTPTTPLEAGCKRGKAIHDEPPSATKRP